MPLGNLLAKLITFIFFSISNDSHLGCWALCKNFVLFVSAILQKTKVKNCISFFIRQYGKMKISFLNQSSCLSTRKYYTPSEFLLKEGFVLDALRKEVVTTFLVQNLQKTCYWHILLVFWTIAIQNDLESFAQDHIGQGLMLASLLVSFKTNPLAKSHR